TYDPTAHYRAAAVYDFQVAEGLTPLRLREISRHQVGVLKHRFETLDCNPSIAHVVNVPDDLRGGFLAIRAPRAAEISKTLRERGIFTDARGEILRVGPAPYLSDEQLLEAIDGLDDVLKDR